MMTVQRGRACGRGGQPEVSCLKLMGFKCKSKPEHTHQDGFFFLIKSVGGDVEKLEPLCAIGREVKWCSHCREKCGSSSKT